MHSVHTFPGSSIVIIAENWNNICPILRKWPFNVFVGKQGAVSIRNSFMLLIFNLVVWSHECHRFLLKF